LVAVIPWFRPLFQQRIPIQRRPMFRGARVQINAHDSSVPYGTATRFQARIEVVSGVCSDTPNNRALLVEDVFRRFIEARVEFILALERCAFKGWPDRRAAIRSNTHLQELFYELLSLRLKHLVLRNDSDDIGWNEYTSTEKVHVRVQDGWSEDEEQALRLRDKVYAQIQSEILKVKTATDPPALDGPFAMVKRDPELLSAWSRLNNTVLALDRELSLEFS
jgi:hypothetical protein